MKLQSETGGRRRHGRWYDDACGTAFAMELVGERWSLLIVRELMLGALRFSDLRAGLPGISAKVLTERLEGLEHAGIVRKRRLSPPAAAQVYELTEWGLLAERAILELGRWAATSPRHDPTLPLSPASLMLSLRTMFRPDLAEGVALEGAIRVGDQPFVVGVAGSALTARRGEAADPQFALAAPVASAIAGAVHGKLPFADLASAGLAVEGDLDAARRFTRCFAMPAKVG